MDKRSLERKPTAVFFGIYNRDNAKYVGRLVDISSQGLMIIGKSQLPVDKCFKLKMDLPQELNGKSQIEFEAKIRWCEKSKKTRLFCAGLQFTAIEPVYSELIDDLIRNSMFNDPAAALPISITWESVK